MPHNETVTRTLYFFDELSEKAKERARDWYREGNLDYEWWDYTYNDAANIGLKITGFDLDRHRHVSGNLTLPMTESIEAILKNHGEECDTYALALKFQVALATLKLKEDEEGDCNEDDRENLEEEYRMALCEEYATMLQKESEFLQSDESVDETIVVNEYEFLENGERA